MRILPKLDCFVLFSECSVASGVRRIEAVCGKNILNLLDMQRELLQMTAESLKISNIEELANKANALIKTLKEKDIEIEKLQSSIANSQIEGIFENAKEINGIKFVTAEFSGTTAEALRSICDRVKSEMPDVVAVLASVSDGGEKISFAAAVGKAALAKGAHAGNILKQICAIAGGSGGGRPDSAMGGGKDATKIDVALAASADILFEMTK